MKIQNQNDLLSFLLRQQELKPGFWFGFPEQKITGVQLAHQLAINFADIMTPEQVANYVVELNNQVFDKIIKG